MKYRTDLAIESKELIDEQNGRDCEVEGVIMQRTEYGENVSSVKIEITNAKGAQLLEKPEGTYITIEAEGILDENAYVKEAAEKALRTELEALVPLHDNLKVLVAGLGNNEVTPDALGPAAVNKVKSTRHMFLLIEGYEGEGISNVCCIIPGVMGVTGIESAEVIKRIADLTDPEVVIIIDSLAARNMERLSTTIQITDTGISPGAGMGNRRTGISRETIGRKVIAIGVPTVIDAATIVRDSLTDNIDDLERIDTYLDSFKVESIVTSTDIDMIIKEFSDIISNGINKVLHPGIYF